MGIPDILLSIGLIFSVILIANLIISIFSRIRDKLKKRERGPTQINARYSFGDLKKMRLNG